MVVGKWQVFEASPPMMEVERTESSDDEYCGESEATGDDGSRELRTLTRPKVERVSRGIIGHRGHCQVGPSAPREGLALMEPTTIAVTQESTIDVLELGCSG